jgi:hypothetical protein
MTVFYIEVDLIQVFLLAALRENVSLVIAETLATYTSSHPYH